jgi:hypothetical protein
MVNAVNYKFLLVTFGHKMLAVPAVYVSIIALAVGPFTVVVPRS